MIIPADYPKIVYNSVTLWLPRRFAKWDVKYSVNPVITDGLVYSQVVSNPGRYTVACTTAKFENESYNYDSSGAKIFTLAYQSFLDWAMAGKVFSFYRKATDSTAGLSYFQYCVWNQKDDGVTMLLGHERYEVNISFITEGASR